ncbi:MAG: hypothetical protein E7395_03125 [Ruminococcaceae bacterium]|nr:hypothetical protein [Oscillospiraceae bacterium]
MDNKKVKKEKQTPSQCDMCAYYDYDEDWEEYVCGMNMDEDDMIKFYQSRTSCPYFRFYDEYKIVRKQN